MNYIEIKYFHIACVTLSGGLFLLRGFWMMDDSAMLQRRWVKIAPHLIDTLLLASALIMVLWSGQYPIVENWLTAKLIALMVYIGLGTIALKRGKNKTVRTCAFVAALVVFAYMGLVAITKHALVFSS